VERRTLGRTGVDVSVLGMGCGAVGGLMVRGAPADQERAVARALELGINLFDTAPSYGDGRSETNTGRALARVAGGTDASVFLSTKFTIRADDHGNEARAVSESLEASLRRLGRDRVDLLQLHNAIGPDDGGRTLEPARILGEVVPALARLRDQGKIRFTGITAVGSVAALRQVIDAGAFDTAQIPYNLLNPSPVGPMPPGIPGQDFGQIGQRAHDAGMGTIGIRALAGGALSGTTVRDPIGMPSVAPMGTGADYAADVEGARLFEALVRAGYAGGLIEAAMRFAITTDAISTALVGLANLEQLEVAAAAVNRGPLPAAALAGLPGIWEQLAAR